MENEVNKEQDNLFDCVLHGVSILPRGKLMSKGVVGSEWPVMC